jgi:hypothetical protein
VKAFFLVRNFGRKNPSAFGSSPEHRGAGRGAKLKVSALIKLAKNELELSRKVTKFLLLKSKR